MRDNAYVLDLEGFVYTTDRREAGFTERHAAVVMLGVNPEPFEVVLRSGEHVCARAMVVGPMVERQLFSPHGGLVDFHVFPLHPLYPHFVNLPAPGALAIDREAFADWDELLAALHAGTTGFDAARAEFDAVLERTAQLLPQRSYSNPTQVQQVLDMLRHDPDSSLAALAEQMDLSVRWMSKLFQQALGMSYRDYQTGRKHRRAMEMLFSRRSLTDLAHEAGFADSPHFTRAFQRWYGQLPSFSRDPANLRVCLPNGRVVG